MSKPRKTSLQKLIDLLPPGRLETIQAASEQVKELSRTYREPLAVVAATVAVIQAHRTGGGW